MPTSTDHNSQEPDILEVQPDGSICAGAQLGEGSTLKFRLPGMEDEAFLLRLNGEVHAFVNLCPHWGVPLDQADNRFFEPRAGRIICRNHGAEFDPQSGRCLAGPADGDCLHRLRVQEHGGTIYYGRAAHEEKA